MHTIKFGVELHYDQINTDPSQTNGSFNFYGTQTGTGPDFADFLLGLPSQYTQNDCSRFTAATSMRPVRAG